MQKWHPENLKNFHQEVVHNFLNTEFFLEKKQHLAISDQYYDQFFPNPTQHQRKDDAGQTNAYCVIQY